MDLTNYDHVGVTSCTSCHDGANTNQIAPKRGRPISNTHPNTGDCATCHSYPEWATVTSVNHATAESCNSCHENSRPTIAEHKKVEDCSTCHQYNSGQWAPLMAGSFDHMAMPAEVSCKDCHYQQIPADGSRANRFNYTNQNLAPAFFTDGSIPFGGKHYVGTSCSECHQAPASGASPGSSPFDFDQSRHLGYKNVMVKSCLPCHFSDGYEEHAPQGNGGGDGKKTSKVQTLNGGNCTDCHDRGRSWSESEPSLPNASHPYTIQ